MKLKNLFILVAFLGLFTACNSTNSNYESADSTETEDSGQHFGEAIEADGAVSYQDLMGQLSNVDSVQTKFVGTVDAVCQTKGCWMTIVDDEAKGEEIFVKFKDYGFFVPKDISGRKVVMDGYAFKEVTSVDELKHYAEDNEEPQEVIDAITEPKEELKFMASGVLLLPEEESTH